MFKLFARIAYVIIDLIQALIIFRFAIIFFNISSSNSIIKWILNKSATFVSPFKGILDSDTLKLGTFTLDLNSIVAFFFFLILGFVIIEIIRAFSTD